MPENQEGVEQPLYFNGIDITRGDDLLPPLTPEEILDIAKGQRKRQDQDPDEAAHVDQLVLRHERQTATMMGPIEGVDPKNLAETGWGVIFAGDDQDSPAIWKALKELLDHRKEQATRIKEGRYQEYGGANGYLPGDTGIKFMARHGADASKPVDPDKSPYYLLIVGDPARIPYRFQYQLDVQYAVGRIHFDTLDEYARYAHSVVEAEKKAEAEQWSLPRRAAFFGPANEGDTATRLSADHLVKPLAEWTAATFPQWAVDHVLPEQALKTRLGDLLGGDQTPALLFTASHGAGLPYADDDQVRHQGALICQDWVRATWPKGQRIPADYFFSADDVGDDARLLGLIAFHFACFGAGTPRLDDFPFYDDSWDPWAPRPFVASLPRRLLGHPQGGALAVVGHVDRAWDTTFTSTYGGVKLEQLQVFQSTLGRLLAGFPVGAAVEYFNDTYAALSTFLTDEIHYLRQGKVPDPASVGQLAGLWTANNDARGYVIVGDPAVRLAAGRDKEAPAERPVIDTVTIRSGSVTLGQVPAGAEQPPGAGGSFGSRPLPGSGTSQTYSVSGTVVLQPGGLVDVRLGSGGLPPAVAEDYFLGIGAKGAEVRDKLVEALKGFADRVGQAVQAAIEDVANLDVTTYTSDEITQVDRDNLKDTAELRAYTRITPTGDVEVCVPSRGGEVDQALWAVHVDMVHQAQANRTEMIKAVVEAVTGLAKVL
jgi:hypothetical protein